MRQCSSVAAGCFRWERGPSDLLGFEQQQSGPRRQENVLEDENVTYWDS